MNETTKPDPLAAALAKLLKNESVCKDGDYSGSMRRLFFALQVVDHGYRDTPERPHSVSAFRAELDRRAIELHRDHRIMVTILDEAGEVEDDNAEEVSVYWAGA
jgi:hypothetical protein